MAVYQFPIMTVKGCGTTSAATYRISIASMTLATYSISWAGALAADLNPLIEIPELGDAQSPMTGAQLLKGGTLTFVNEAFRSDGTRISELFTDYNPWDTRWFLRLELYNGSSYDVLADYMLMNATIKMTSPEKPDTWRVTVQAVDPLLLLEEIDVSAVQNELPHATYDVAAANIYLTYMWSGSATVQRFTNILWKDRETNFEDWVTPDNLRFFKLVDVLEAFARVMGLTTALNDGAAMDHEWVYNAHNGMAAVPKSFADLHIVSAYYYDLTVYQHYYTFFDVNRYADHSLYNAGSALEALKSLIMAHGLEASIRINASGEMYLAINQLRHNTERTFPRSSWRQDAEMSPADQMITGVVVNTSNDGEIVRGTSGDGADAMKCPYTSAARIIAGARWRDRSPGTGPTDDWPCVGSALWVLDGTTMRNVYSVEVKCHGQIGGTGTWAPPEAWYWTSGMLFSEAAARYYYNPAPFSSDPIGLRRPIMRRLKFDYPGLQQMECGDYMEYDGVQWWILEYTWHVYENYTTIIAETGEW